MKRWIFKILYLCCIAVFIFSTIQLVNIMKEYRQAEDFYDGAADSFTEQNQDAGTESPEPDTESIQEAAKAPISVDFTDILKINDDVVGWIYMEDTVVNYPLLQGENNFYYLDKTYWKKYLASGSIYLDSGNSRLMTDAHSIIYGHNMKNHTMFGDLSDFRNGEYLEAHPYIDLFLIDGTWLRYEIFSVYKAHVDDGTFRVPLNSESALAELLQISSEKNRFGPEGSQADSGLVLPQPEASGTMEEEWTGSRILTLSTCTENSSDTERFVVQGVLVQKNGLPYSIIE